MSEEEDCCDDDMPDDFVAMLNSEYINETSAMSDDHSEYGKKDIYSWLHETHGQEDDEMKFSGLEENFGDGRGRGHTHGKRCVQKLSYTFISK